MTIILNIPRDITLDVFSEWIKIKELGHLDVSVGLRHGRQDFLNILKCIPHIRVSTSSKAVFKWIYKREMQLRNLFKTNFAFAISNLSDTALKNLKMWSTTTTVTLLSKIEFY